MDLFIFFTKGINFKITSEDLLISIKGNYKFQAGNFSSLRLTLERAGTDGEVKIQVGKKPKGFSEKCRGKIGIRKNDNNSKIIILIISVLLKNPKKGRGIKGIKTKKGRGINGVKTKKGRGIVFYGDLNEAIPLGGTSNL
ncbi:MAG: hypothetical protein HDS42_04245 [Bacteroides sp.]|nr:hypothetical protein [Bacteroides sp.]